MSVAVAIIGIALLVLIHEMGHFFAARAVGMTPRKFYLGFGPPLVKRTRGGVEYGIGAIPLGGYVKIPGMSRPSPGDLAVLLPESVRREHQAELARLDTAIAAGDDEAASAALAELEAVAGKTRAWRELQGALAPDAYWRQATWRRLVVIFAGPAVNLVFAIVLFACLFAVSTTRTTTTVGAVVPGSPAAHAGVRVGDHILDVAGRPVTVDDLTTRIRATHGRPFSLSVDRHGRRVAIPLSARRDSDGIYRVGVEMESRTGPGEPVPAAIGDAFKETWQVTADTVRGLGRLAAGRDTNQVSGTVGIVRVSSSAFRQSAHDFLDILALVSLSLGLLNLVPLLPLDGGHILIALIEKVRGRTFQQAVYVRYSVVGLMLATVLMYLGLRNDLFGGGG